MIPQSQPVSMQSPTSSACATLGAFNRRRSSEHIASHIHEFGDFVHVVHVPRESEATLDIDHEPTHHNHRRHNHHHHHHLHKNLSFQDRFRHFRRSLFRKRKLMQYFYNDVLFRSKERRQLSREELFLDLVLVAAIAALGHQLRVSITWSSLQTFVLLFAAIYSAWREIVLLWNLWALKDDLIAKIIVYCVFVCITGISVAALNPFSERHRMFVSLSAFFATLVPLLGHAIWSSLEPLLRIEGNRVNHMWLAIFFTFLGILPYLIAAFIQTELTAKLLFFAAMILQPLGMVAGTAVYHFLHRKVDTHSRLALSIDHIAEKLEVMTLIFLGESAISFLSEAGSLAFREDARVYQIYICCLFSTAMLYALQTLYVQVDSTILRGGVHALRYDQYSGLLWMVLHWPYHLFLMLFATGMGIGVRDIIVPPILEEVARESDLESTVGEVIQFSRSAKWCFCVGWGGSILFSGLISSTHLGGPRALTRFWRLIIRFTVAIGLTAGMPFANIKAGRFQQIFAGVTVMIALIEFLLVKADKAGLFMKKAKQKNKVEDVDEIDVDEEVDANVLEIESSSSSSSSSTSSDEDDGNGNEGELDEIFDGEGFGDANVSAQIGIQRQLTRRMEKGHASKLVAVRQKAPKRRRRLRALG